MGPIVTVCGGGVRGKGSRCNQGVGVKGGFNQGGRQARKQSPGRGQTQRQQVQIQKQIRREHRHRSELGHPKNTQNTKNTNKRNYNEIGEGLGTKTGES